MSLAGADPFRFVRYGRSRRTALAAALAWALICGVWLAFDAALWLLAPFALATLPALWDLWRNPRAGLVLDDEALTWQAGGRSATLKLSEIKYFEFNTRLDFSVRVRAVPHQGRPKRLPDAALPPHKALEAALTARGVSCRRHHFRLF